MTKSYIKDYPRPQLVRQQWENLNGTWDFLFDDEEKGEAQRWFSSFPASPMQICVPFTYETAKSGIGDETLHQTVWYHRTFSAGHALSGGRHMLLHLEGCDFETDVWVNGIHAGSHKGGYARFSFDITLYLKEGENHLTVRARDSMSIEQPRGKQRWAKENYECWYVQTTGIWKTVWLEETSPVYLASIKATPDLTEGKIRMEYRVAGATAGKELMIDTTVSFSGTVVARSSRQITRSLIQDEICLAVPEETPWGIHTWAPDSPELYDVSICIRSGNHNLDEVQSYFAMRDVRIEKGHVLLNGIPVYQRLILDQGYWKESHLTPPDEQALIDDIDKLLAMGYNGVRKHMKTEDERFLYWCDVKGMLVWSEMAAAYEFTDEAVEEFTHEWLEIVRQNYSHPCIITWTPFNESWGVPRIKFDRKQQKFTEAIYDLTRSIDAMRPIIANDGWEHTVSDILTLHDYEEDGDVFFGRYNNHLEEIGENRIYHSGWKSAMAEGYAWHGQPVIISEFGGIAFAGGAEGAWGYGNTVESEEAFLRRFDKITTAIKKLPYVCGFCYTQVSDVQQEINGLLDSDHNYKIAPEKIREINLRPVGPRKMERTLFIPD